MQTSVIVPAVEAGVALPGAPPSASPTGAADSDRFFLALLGALLSAAPAPAAEPAAEAASAEPRPAEPRADDPAQASWLGLWLPLLNPAATAAPVAAAAPAGTGDTPLAGSAAAPVTPAGALTVAPATPETPGPAWSHPGTPGAPPALTPADAGGRTRPIPEAAASATPGPAGAPAPRPTPEDAPLDARSSVAAPFAATTGATPGASTRPAHPARPQTDAPLRLTDGVLPDRPTEAAPSPGAPGVPEQPAPASAGAALPAPDTRDLSPAGAGPGIHASTTATPPARPLTDSALDAIVHQARLTTVPGRSSVRLRLQPAELGTVEVTIDVTSRGAAVRLATASPEAQAAIERQLPALRGALEASGFSADRLTVTAGPLGAGLAGQPSFDLGRQGLPWRHDQPPAPAGASRAGGTAGAGTTITPSPGALARSGLIDCRA
jgi:flagellar hook-length control protein FliK